MKASQHWHWPARPGSRAALTLGLAVAALTLGLAGTAITGGLAGATLAGSHQAGHRFWWPRAVQHDAVSWGDGVCAVLGYGGSTVPAQVSGLGSSVAQVSGEASGQNCVAAALMSDGTVWAWGSNYLGQLGNGTTTDSTAPVQVTGLTGVTQVAAGTDHSLALKSDGTVWAWGADAFGQLGNGITTQDVPVPVQVTGLTGVTKIATGPEYSLALRSDGTVWAWGLNDVGQLGNGTTTDSTVPVQVTGLTRVTNISAGTSSALATRTNGLTALSQVWAWGANDQGQLGDGTTTGHLTPELVTGINTPFVAGISAGNNFAVVLGTDGSVWGWGADEHGQLGFGPTGGPVTRPVQMLVQGSGITQVSAGGYHVLALESNGNVEAWGYNAWGQLGDGTTTDSLAPVQVTGLANVTQVAAGYWYSLAVHTVQLLIRA